jgi:hypothetical protein
MTSTVAITVAATEPGCSAETTKTGIFTTVQANGFPATFC